jgi:sterol desaturase/sphingolipid hydroxylase (fatty acid hydroxylase superfamily)
MENAVSLGIFVAIFATLALAEMRWAKRPLAADKGRRWRANLGLALVNLLLQRVTLGAAMVLAAQYAEARGWGLFNLFPLPFWLEAILVILVLDAAIYLQHVATHLVPVLWRLHKVHHADLDIDTSTGLRFHPVEILLSLVYKAALVLALGADPWLALAYGVILSSFSLFTHSNIALPAALDRALRFVICTPDMHRRHHSVLVDETNSNYGNFLSAWDRLFGTYFWAPRLGHDKVVLGLADCRAEAKLGLVALLAMPFRRS